MGYLAKPRTPEDAVHLKIGDSLVRVLTRVKAHWQVGVLSFPGAAMPQLLASLEMLEVRKIHTVTILMGTNDVSRGDWRKITMLPEKVSCLLQEVWIYLDHTILMICTAIK